MALRHLIRRSPTRRASEQLYDQAVAQAREPAFYTQCGVPDTPEGRFDMIALHVYLILRRLRQGGGGAAEVAQALFDTMFDDMDRSLREAGVGDLSVGKRVKALAQAFYGRIAAYDKGLDTDDAQLTEALVRNVFRMRDPGRPQLDRLAAYMRREDAALARSRLDGLLEGEIAFGPAPPSG